MTALLEIRDLCVEFHTQNGVVNVLDGINFRLNASERMSFVGESGCGKSMTALALMGLLPPMGRVSSGTILFNGEDLTQASDALLRQIRGNEISMIFQEPMTSLNPLLSIGNQLIEVLQLHRKLSAKDAMNTAIELLDAVKLPNPDVRVKDYPHQLSGGQRQRVMIAIALACQPKILIADEPTTALDVTVQAEIFDLLFDLSHRLGTAIILISHDMGAVAMLAEKVLVMYAGRKIEEGTVAQIIHQPRHPYTKGLIQCVPHIQTAQSPRLEALPEIPGIVPSLHEFGGDVCLFAPRCSKASDICVREKPQERVFSDGHLAACWHPQ